MINSNFTHTGLPIGDNSVNMTYLYGLSDFFSVMFENTETVNLLLEATSESAADVYSRFLQLTSSLSLADIQTSIGSSIKLILVQGTSAVAGRVNTFLLPSSVVSSTYIANKPLLPTALLETEVDYRIEVQPDGGYYLVLSKSMDSFGFPVRVLPDGTHEYALWFVDAQIDEQLISKTYAGLIGVSPQASTDLFKNYVYGMYYMYTQGPTLSLIRKGLNLSLGIPLARGSETVLSIRTYLDTDQYLVITDQNQYVVPYGLYPVVSVGQALQASDEIAQWVIMKDWTEDGAWWINLAIPPSVLPSLPDNQVNRYATAGSKIEYLMRTYLKSHTFLVSVNVSTFKDNQVFQSIASILKEVKPSYTSPVYIWTIPYMEDVVASDDSKLSLRRDLKIPEDMTYPIEKFRRDALVGERVSRGTPVFIRMSTPPMVQRLLADAQQDAVNFSINSSTVTGFVNSQNQYRTNTTYETNWVNTLFSRYNDAIYIPRSKAVMVSRGTNYGNTIGKPYGTMVGSDKRVLPMYVLTQSALEAKCAIWGINAPSRSAWKFSLFVSTADDSINSSAINDAQANVDVYNMLTSNYSTVFSRSAADYPSNPLLPNWAKSIWVPSSVSALSVGDYVIGMRIMDDLVGLYFVTSNMTLNATAYISVPSNDTVAVTSTGPMMRGLCPTQSPLYLARGRGGLSYNSVYTEINAAAINDATDGVAGSSTIDNAYTDYYNPGSVQVTRKGGLHLKQVLTQ